MIFYDYNKENVFFIFVLTKGRNVWTDILTKMVEEFGDVLDIENEPIILDGRVSQSEGMNDLRKQLQITAQRIRASISILISYLTNKNSF